MSWEESRAIMMKEKLQELTEYIDVCDLPEDKKTKIREMLQRRFDHREFITDSGAFISSFLDWLLAEKDTGNYTEEERKELGRLFKDLKDNLWDFFEEFTND